MNTGRFACAGCANIRKVIAMYVVPEAAGRGVGKSLLQALIAEAGGGTKSRRS